MLGMLLRFALPVGLAYGAVMLLGGRSAVSRKPSEGDGEGAKCQFETADAPKAVDEVVAWVEEQLGTAEGLNVGGGKLAKMYWEAKFPSCPVPTRPAQVANKELWSVNDRSWKEVRDGTAAAIDEFDPGDPGFHNRRVARAILGYDLDAEI